MDHPSGWYIWTMMGRGVLLERRLPPRATSARIARRLVAEALESTSYADAVDSARVAVSELVTNALVHAGTDIGVQVRIDDDGLLVEVEDGNPQLPSLRKHARESGTGRGLRLVEDLADEWGIYRRDGHKVVWFRIGNDVSLGSPSSDAGGEASQEDAARVVLLEFPLLLHSAWQEHSSALLREYLLMSLNAGDDDGDEVVAFQRHAEACELLHMLSDQVPGLDVGDDPDAVMADAVEPLVTMPMLVLNVPRSMLRNVEVYTQMMDEAVHTADDGSMLVPTTQPELREMRRWLCDQIRGQALTGAAPEPYAADLHHSLVSDRVAQADWDGGDVSTTDRAIIMSNDSGQIVAVSGPAARFLGYTPEELVGRRVLTVIPQRFRQAHVAGLTLHMINGRRPLLDHEVTVPMLCADGTEKVATLVVSPGPSQAHRVFVAEVQLPSA